MYETRHFTIDFFQMNATSYFQFPAFLLKKKQSKLNFGNGNREYRCGVPKIRTGTNVKSSITKFHST